MKKKKHDSVENFEAQFKKATLPLIVLKILSEREMYAYEIEKEILQRSNGTYKPPALYTTLRNLQAQGIVQETNKVISDDNRLRIYYKVTDEGLVYFETIKKLYAELDQFVWSTLYGKTPN